jgi:hypothetical protein
VSVRLVRLGADGSLLGQWQGAPEGAADGWTEAAPGWSLAVPVGGGLAAAAGEWLQVWVTVRIRDAAGERQGRLFLALEGGAGA